MQPKQALAKREGLLPSVRLPFPMHDLGKRAIVGVGTLLLLNGVVLAVVAPAGVWDWPQDPAVGVALVVIGSAVIGLGLRPPQSEIAVSENRTSPVNQSSALGRPQTDIDGVHTFQAVVGPPISLKVETPAGDFTLVYRDVTVVGHGGSVAGYFTCSGQDNFIREAKAAGWTCLDPRAALDEPIPLKRNARTN